jgi:plastocyanin
VQFQCYRIVNEWTKSSPNFVVLEKMMPKRDATRTPVRPIQPRSRRHTPNMKSIALVIAAAVTLLAAAPAPAAQTTTVHIRNFAYVPQNVTVHAGTTITFVNDDDEAHTVSATDKTFDSGGLDTNQKWQHTFKTPGKFNYFCEMHPYMKGTVTVI